MAFKICWCIFLRVQLTKVILVDVMICCQMDRKAVTCTNENTICYYIDVSSGLSALRSLSERV